MKARLPHFLILLSLFPRKDRRTGPIKKKRRTVAAIGAVEGNGLLSTLLEQGAKKGFQAKCA